MKNSLVHIRIQDTRTTFAFNIVAKENYAEYYDDSYFEDKGLEFLEKSIRADFFFFYFTNSNCTDIAIY